MKVPWISNFAKCPRFPDPPHKSVQNVQVMCLSKCVQPQIRSNPHEKPPLNQHFPMVFSITSQLSYHFPMVFLWFSYFPPAGFPRVSRSPWPPGSSPWQSGELLSPRAGAPQRAGRGARLAGKEPFCAGNEAVMFSGRMICHIHIETYIIYIIIYIYTYT